MAYKQKRGPGFKYASNLPGSLLKEQRANRDVKDEADLASTAVAVVPTAKRKAEREETPKRKPEEPPRKRPSLPLPDGLPQPRPEENPLRKKRKLFDKDPDPIERKRVQCSPLWLSSCFFPWGGVGGGVGGSQRSIIGNSVILYLNTSFIRFSWTVTF